MLVVILLRIGSDSSAAWVMLVDILLIMGGYFSGW